MLDHHMYELKRRIEKLFHLGMMEIETWELLIWYGRDDAFDKMYLDVQMRFESEFLDFYGDIENAHIQVLRQFGKTLFLNQTELVRLDALMDK